MRLIFWLQVLMTYLFAAIPNGNASSEKPLSRVFVVRGNDDLVYAENFFNDIYQEFFHEKSYKDLDIIVVGHLVPTLPVYLRALEKIGHIAVLIPKSSHPNPAVVSYVQDKLLKEVVCLNQEQKRAWFKDKNQVIAMINKYVKRERFLIIDIGGYFSYTQNALKEQFGDRFLGIVEDTENGHQKYNDALSNVAVLSVARSSLKELEDYNVGKSIVEASDALLRKSAHTMISRIKTVGVIGFGKIGQSIATHAREKGIKRILVYDKNPMMTMKASAFGFEAVSREVVLQESEMIFSATGSRALKGEDLKVLKDNVFIASCTSSDDEFDPSFFTSLRDRSDSEEISRYLGRGINKRVNLLNNGNAVNFVFDAVNGPYIYAVMSSLIVSAKRLIDSDVLPCRQIGYIPTFGVYGKDAARDVDQISKLWLRNFESVQLPASDCPVSSNIKALSNQSKS